MAGIQGSLFKSYGFPTTDVNLDWMSIVLHGEAAELGRYGYSRDRRPDKQQLTLGLCELASPVNVPIGMTVRAGNLNDQSHFKATYSQVRHLLKDESLVIFDKGASSQENKELVRYDRMCCLSSKKLNRSDGKGIVGVIYEKPRSTDYFYFSKSLHGHQIKSVRKRARKMADEAIELQRDLDAGKKVKRKFRGGVRGNVLINAATTFQTKLVEMTEEAHDYAFSRCKNGREGFFCLKSSKRLTLSEALATCRKKDSIEIKPARCWKKERLFGVLLIGFLAQLFISLLRCDLSELASASAKFIKKKPKEFDRNACVGRKRRQEAHFLKL